jgi:crossover junction endodeoxyribonuclease RuvC
MKVSIGIDPGLAGAVAILDYRTDPPTVTVHDTPTLTLTGPRGAERHEYDLHGMARLLAPYAGASDAQAFIERVHAFPDQGVRSMFTLGYGAGAWEGVLTALCIAFRRVLPRQWQRDVLRGQLKGKDAARFAAMTRFPLLAHELRLKRHHNRADALLIAEWGRMQDPEARVADLVTATRREYLPTVTRQLLTPSRLLESLTSTKSVR